MRALKFLVLVGIVFLLMPQCKKPPKINIQPVNLSQLMIPNGLDWKMVHPVNFHITDAPIDLI